MKIKQACLVLLTVFLLFGCTEDEDFEVEHILTLPPLHEQFADHFPMIGNIFRGSFEVTGTGTGASITNLSLTRHFNALTAENHMKPSYLITGHNNGNFTWNTTNQTTVDNFINAANNANIKVIGHTLLWHSQNPNWVWEQIASKTGTNIINNQASAINIMKGYITAVASLYAGKIYSWDVLNEAFPDNASGGVDWKNAIRRGAGGEGQDANPWYVAIGSDFVYQGFLAARIADPTAILYYNDYNTESPNRARLIRDMVRDVNNAYFTGNDRPPGEDPDRLLIEGIGMQEHHNLSVSASSISATINLFRSLNVEGRRNIKLAVTELDVIAFSSYSAFSSAAGGGTGTNKDTNSGSPNQSSLIMQGNLFRDYMNVYIANKDIIERVSLWGVQDNHSWRSFGKPLLFDRNGNTKPAYYRFISAL